MDREGVLLECGAPAVSGFDPGRHVRKCGPYNLGYELSPGSTMPPDLDEIAVAGRPLVLPSEEEEEGERKTAIYAK